MDKPSREVERGASKDPLLIRGKTKPRADVYPAYGDTWEKIGGPMGVPLRDSGRGWDDREADLRPGRNKVKAGLVKFKKLAGEMKFDLKVDKFLKALNCGPKTKIRKETLTPAIGYLAVPRPPSSATGFVLCRVI
ncbi:hypothetical protein HPP92_000440 [Vanilla planifolia]|uniref:Uncharacterized protein n=1 Tax=Vanilla planifolia TaxID=51239 RepID=A0A835RUF8_VANPL|nr:hypothetical protein HPP92_000440 [Vanilla planifolia]